MRCQPINQSLTHESGCGAQPSSHVEACPFPPGAPRVLHVLRQACGRCGQLYVGEAALYLNRKLMQGIHLHLQLLRSNSCLAVLPTVQHFVQPLSRCLGQRGHFFISLALSMDCIHLYLQLLGSNLHLTVLPIVQYLVQPLHGSNSKGPFLSWTAFTCICSCWVRIHTLQSCPKCNNLHRSKGPLFIICTKHVINTKEQQV